MTDSLAGALFVLAIIVFVLIALRNRLSIGGGQEPWPYYAKKPLSNPEQVLYYRLVSALPECMVLAQVQLSRILGVKKGFNRTVWYNRVAQKSVDFVVCLKDSTVVAVVELDDSTHQRAARRTADTNKDKALNAAGVPVLRWNVKALPDEATIRAALAA